MTPSTPCTVAVFFSSSPLRVGIRECLAKLGITCGPELMAFDSSSAAGSARLHAIISQDVAAAIAAAGSDDVHHAASQASVLATRFKWRRAREVGCLHELSPSLPVALLHVISWLLLTLPACL